MPTKNGKIITIAQHKGGAGKTTLSTQLAAALSDEGHDVFLLDVDPQGSSTEWMRMREHTLGRGNKIKSVQAEAWKLNQEFRNLKKDYDYVIVDTPPHAEKESSDSIKAADLVLVPIQPSPLDVWACAPTLKLILAERKPLMLVLNRVPAKSKLNDTIVSKLETMGIQIARQTLGNRVVFASSTMSGLGVIEFEPRSTASDEMHALLKDIKKHKAFKAA